MGRAERTLNGPDAAGGRLEEEPVCGFVQGHGEDAAAEAVGCNCLRGDEEFGAKKTYCLKDAHLGHQAE